MARDGTKTGGRIKGTPNSVTSNAKGAIERCFEEMGGIMNLVKWAKDNQTDFYKIVWPKILPLTLAGDPDKPLQTKITVEVIK